MKPLRYAVEVLRNAVQDLVRRPTPAILSIAAMTVAVSVLGAFLVLSRHAQAVLDAWSQRATVEAFLDEGAGPDLVAAVERAAIESGIAAEVSLVEEGEALAEFRSLYPDLADVEQLLGENPFPRSIRIATDAEDRARVESLVAELKEMQGVSGVRYDQEWIDALGRLGEALGWFAAAGTLVCLFAALVTIGSVVRLALDDKKEEIRLLRLTGAPAGFVVAPILVAGGLLGIAGGSCALAALGAGRVAIAGTPLVGLFGDWQALESSLTLPPSMQAALLAFAAAAGALAAGLAGAREASR